MNKVWVYRSRCGNHGVFTGDHDGFERARARQDDDNMIALTECINQGFDVGGGEEKGFFYIDDGGTIDLFRVE